MATPHHHPLPTPGLRVRRVDGKVCVYQVTVWLLGHLEVHQLKGRKVYKVLDRVFSDSTEAAEYMASTQGIPKQETAP